MGRLQRVAEHRGDNNNLVWRDHYEYDRYGNRWQSSYENTGRFYIETYQTDYDTATNRFVAPWWQYDAAGNLTEDQIFGYQSHVYDAKSRNVSVTSLATQQVVSSAVYDGLGQRVQTVEGSVTRRQVYDASGMMLAEYENGYLKRECIYGNGELLSTVKPGNGVRHQLNDQQGSSRVVMDDNGLIKARHDYYPFGEEIGYVGMRLGSQGYGQTDGNRKRYAGMEKDGPTGQDHTWFRKADTRSGRWTSPDPSGGSLSISNPQSTNRYTYVENDPLNGVDPSGLLTCLIDGMDFGPGSCGLAFGLLQMGAGVLGPLETTRWNPSQHRGQGGYEHFRAEAHVAGWGYWSAVTLNFFGQLFADTDWHWNKKLGTPTYWQGQLAFDFGGVIRDFRGGIIGEHGVRGGTVDKALSDDPVIIAAGILSGGLGAIGAGAATGVAGETVVIGRLPVTGYYRGLPGGSVLPSTGWSLQGNMAWLADAIERRATFFLASEPIATNLAVKGVPTVFGREFQALVNAGYTRFGPYMVPPR